MEPQASDSPSSLPFKKRARMNDTSQQQQQQQQGGGHEASSSSSLPAMTNIIHNNTHSSNALNSLSRISPETATAIAALTPESVHMSSIHHSTSKNSASSRRTSHNNSPTDCLEETLNPDLCIEKALKAADEAWGSVSNQYLQTKVLFTLDDVFVMIRPDIDQMMKQELMLEKKSEHRHKKKNSKQTSSKSQKSQKTSTAGGTTNAATAAASKSTTATTVPKRGKTLPNLSSVQKIPVQQQPVVATPTPITQSTSNKRTRATFEDYPYPPKSLPGNIPHNLPKSLALPTDSKYINKLHQFVRSDLLEIIQDDGKIGFQCTFCKTSKHPQQLPKFFPKCLENASAGGLYRLVCTWQRVHFKACNDVPEELKNKYDVLKEADRTRGRVQYWEDSAKQIGLWNRKGGGICFIGDHGGN